MKHIEVNVKSGLQIGDGHLHFNLLQLRSVRVPDLAGIFVTDRFSINFLDDNKFINAHPWWGCLEANWDIIDEMKNVEVDR